MLLPPDCAGRTGESLRHDSEIVAAVSGESDPLDGDIEVLRSVFRTGAEACERLDRTNQQLSQALMRVAELEALLARVVEVLEASPLPVDGGSWAILELAQEVQLALGQSEPG